MIEQKFLEQVEDYLEWRCLDKRWIERREKLGKPFDVRKTLCFQSVAGVRDEKWVLEHIKTVQAGLMEAAMGDAPKPITDDERAKTLETHRNYFANYLFALMEQKNFSEADIAAKAHVDTAIFDKLRNVKRYIPEERTIFALIFALELTFNEANDLLHRANRYLSANVWEEVLIAFFLDDQIYDVALLNEVLNHYELAPLEVTEDFSLPPEKNFSDEGLLERIDLYIEEKFFDTSAFEAAEERGTKFSYSVEPLGEPAESVKTFEVIVRKLKDKVGLAGNFFSDYLYKLIKQKNLSDVDVYKRAHLDRRIFSKIRNEKTYMPAKKTVLAIALALKLNLTETNKLLARAGYFLSSARKEDVIAAYFIENQIYDLFLINEVLHYYNCPLLGD